MTDVLLILSVENSLTDAKLIVEELRRIGRPIKCERIEDAAGRPRAGGSA